MNLISWADQKVKSMNVWDWGILKIFCVLIGMILGSFIVSFVQTNMIWLIVICILLLVYLLYRILTIK